MTELYEQLKGAKVATVDAGSSIAKVGFADGRMLRLTLYGDCCSSSFFTNPAQFLELVGGTVREIEERDGGSRDGLPEMEDGDHLCWYFLVFVTDKGHTTIDWRNESNGYYSGSVIAEVVSPET